jgi:hypothetical protein
MKNTIEEYTQSIIDGILETEMKLPKHKRLESSLLDHWIETIQDVAQKNYTNYLIGKRNNYEFNIIELEQTFKDAYLRQTNDLLQGMVEKDLLSIRVDKDGEMLYSLSEKGQYINDSISGKLN